ncbi:MAG: hydroxymethylglutaryl-CoA lyase [Rhodospirillaceae bacterium]|jgi:hydroxymethylglutaryl-CoA lyase
MNQRTEDIDVLVSEVGPRDGLQNAKGIMPTEDKLKWIETEAAAGVLEIEVGSFVPPKLIPGMADTGDVVKGALKVEGITVLALVPNLRGAENAFKAGAHKVTIPISVSEPHSISNVRKNHKEMIEEVRKICELRDSYPEGKRPHVETGLATAFGCSIQGVVDEFEVMRMAEAAVEAGVDEVGLADTVGYANPNQVKRVFKSTRAAIGNKLGSAHFHNTMGLGLANVLAALEVDVRTFDASLGGLGGCPFAPGASGNIVTEDLVFLLESQGLRTGIDIEKLMAVREIVTAALPDDQIYGHVLLAGLPKGFKAAAA